MPEMIFKKKSLMADFAVPISAFLTFLVYLRSLGNGFVNYDDGGYVTENSAIRALSASFFKWAFTSEFMGNYHPLTVISYAIDYRVWGLNPAGFHLTNIVFHSMNTLLVGVLAVKLYRIAYADMEESYYPGVFAGLITALLFGLHPQHVESVAWVSERKDVLSGFFFILSVMAYVRYADAEYCRGNGVYYFLSLVLFVLALMSKPMAVSLPFALIILDFYPLGRLKYFRRAVVEKAPFFALSAVFAVFTVLAQKKGNAVVEHYPLMERVAVAIRAYAFYLYKMMFPLHLIPYYQRPENPFDLALLVSIAVLVLVSLWCVLTAGVKRIFGAAWLYYLITLAPVIGVVQTGHQMAADRYMYIPSIGPFLLVGALAAYFSRRLAENRAMVIFAAAIVLVLGFMTFRQQDVWKDSVRLWSRQIRFSPTSLAYAGRGQGYYETGRFDEAIKDYGAAIEIMKARDRKTWQAIELDSVYNKRGLAYERMGEFPEAVKDFDSALSINAKNAMVYNNRGNAYKKQGYPALAIADLARALELEPGNTAVMFNLGLAYLEAGDKENGIVNIRRAADAGLPEAQAYLKNLPDDGGEF